MKDGFLLLIELRNGPNRWDIAFGMLDGGLQPLEGYHDSELAELRGWWNY